MQKPVRNISEVLEKYEKMDKAHVSLNILSDHLRTSISELLDGVVPGMEPSKASDTVMQTLTKNGWNHCRQDVLAKVEEAKQ